MKRVNDFTKMTEFVAQNPQGRNRYKVSTGPSPGGSVPCIQRIGFSDYAVNSNTLVSYNCSAPLYHSDRPLLGKMFTVCDQSCCMIQAKRAQSDLQDVGCLDKDRVIIKIGPVSYIHANYVSTPLNPKRFICTQVQQISYPFVGRFQ